MPSDAPFANFGDEYAQNSLRHYYANITFIDDQIGEIIRCLKEKDMYDNTIICFTADHGDMMGDHYHWRKTYPYEGSTHIPYIVKWPKTMERQIPDGSRLDYPVELWDFLPTFLDLAGGKIPEDPKENDEFWEKECLEKAGGRSATRHIYFPNGFDQAPIRTNLPQLIKERNEKDPENEYVISCIEDYIKDVKSEKLLKSVLLAAAAGWAAHRFNRISLPILLAVVLFYQVAGTLGEWAMVGSFFQAVQDFRIGLPGMAMQVVGGYALIKYSASL